MSSIYEYPVKRLVFSSFGFYGRHRGALPGVWFIRCFGEFGITAPTVWQTLYRMERAGEVEARRAARDKLYWPTTIAWASLDAGAAKLAPCAEREPWDGTWTIVLLRSSGARPAPLDRARSLLRTEGFVALQPGVFVHPRRRVARIVEAAERTELAGNVTVFRAALEFPEVGRLVKHAWSLDRLRRQYEAFIQRYQRAPAARTPKAAFLHRLYVTLDYLDVAWADPELPPQLLTDAWPGHKARALVAKLNGRFTAAATLFADSLLDDILRTHPPLANAASEHLKEVNV